MNESDLCPSGEPVTGVSKTPAALLQSILVVDDDEDIRRLNSEVLAHYGYQVDTAADGAIAWELLKVRTFDLLITDHHMSKISGVELLQKLHVAQIALPVIMITGFHPGHEFARRPWLQTSGLLPKPYTIADLLDVVGEVLRTGKSSSERMALPPEPSRAPLSDRSS